MFLSQLLRVHSGPDSHRAACWQQGDPPALPLPPTHQPFLVTPRAHPPSDLALIGLVRLCAGFAAGGWAAGPREQGVGGTAWQGPHRDEPEGIWGQSAGNRAQRQTNRARTRLAGGGADAKPAGPRGTAGVRGVGCLPDRGARAGNHGRGGHSVP
jgi:hypothetical protein